MPNFLVRFWNFLFHRSAPVIHYVEPRRTIQQAPASNPVTSQDVYTPSSPSKPQTTQVAEKALAVPHSGDVYGENTPLLQHSSPPQTAAAAPIPYQQPLNTNQVVVPKQKRTWLGFKRKSKDLTNPVNTGKRYKKRHAVADGVADGVIISTPSWATLGLCLGL